MYTVNRKLRQFLAMLVALVASMNIGAIPIPLGSVSSATTLSFSMGGLFGTFENFYTFSIDPGHPFEVRSFTTTGFGNRAFIPDLNGDISDASGIIATGDSEVRYLPPFPAYDVVFEPFVLAAGDYTLRIGGDAISGFPGTQIQSSYSGTITFADLNASVPEPGSVALLACGMLGLGMFRLRWRR